MKLKEIDRVAHNLVAVSALESCALELKYEDHSFREQYRINAESSPTKVVLKHHMANELIARRGKCRSDDWQPLVDGSLKERDTRAPLFCLFGFNGEILQRGTLAKLRCNL